MYHGVPKMKDLDIHFNFLIKIMEKKKSTLRKRESTQKSYHVRKINKNA